MSYFFHPLNKNLDYHGFSNESPAHTVGNLDYSIAEGTPLYAMCDGEVTFAGEAGDIYPITGERNTYCCIKCSKNQLYETFYIRYLHGNYDVHTGDEVTRGQRIGTVGNHGNSDGAHLHIDFAWGGEDGNSPTRRDPPVAGTFEKRGDDTYFKYLNPITNISKEIKVDTNIIDLDQINIWKNETAIPSRLGDIGYCWLVFAQQPQWKEPTEGGVQIDRTVYDNNEHWNRDSPDGITAYYTRTMKDSFLGPAPETWEIYQSNACRGFRAAVSIVMHEYAYFGPFISQVWAKILRAIIIGYSAFHPENVSTLDEWLYNVMNSHTSWVKDYNYNSPDGHWCSKENLESEFGNEALSFVKAYYYNLKYPNIYGSELSSKATGSTQPDALENIVKAAYKIMNGACVAANGFWSIASGAYFMVNWDPDTGKDQGKVPDPSGTQYSGHLVGMRGTTSTGGGTIDTCYEEYLE